MVRKLCSAAGNILIIAAALFFSLMAVLLLMGFRPYVVRSGSMEPALQTEAYVLSMCVRLIRI